jgi:hypothetical protein
MKWPIRLLRVAYVCLISALPVYAIAANYAVTQGTGTTFGSLVVSAVNYAQQLLCDPTTPTQCAAVSAGGALSVAGPVTNAGTFATQLSGATNNINNVSGTVSLPTGAATAANQATMITDITAPVPACAASPCVTTIGRVGIDPTTPGTTNGVTIANDSGTGTAGTTAVAGTTSSSVIAKASAGNLQNAYVTSSAAGWVFIINATSLPSNATLTIGTASGNLQGCFELQKGVTDWGASINYNPGPWEHFSTGIVVAISSTDCPVLTAAATGKFIHSQAN